MIRSKSMQYLQYSLINARHCRTISRIDYPTLFNAYLTYNLPFGRKHKWG